MACHVERLLEQREQPSGKRGRLEGPLDRHLHDCEFVAAEARDGALAGALPEAPRHGPQQRIADRMAEGIVHRLELVEVQAELAAE